MRNTPNKSVKELIKLGLKSQKERNFHEAIKHYENVIEIDSSIVFAHYNLGLINEKLGNTDKAKKNYLRAIKAEPLFIYSYTNLGIIHQKEGEKEKAIEYFKKVIEIDTKNINGYNNLGLVYASQGNYHEAINNYFKSLKIEKRNLIAIKSIIFLLTYFIPDRTHPLVKANNDLRLLQKKFSLPELLQINNISLILNNLEKMDALINGILNYSTLDKEQFGKEVIDLNLLLTQLTEVIYIPEHIELQVPKNFPTIYGDTVRIQQIFQNILQNAINSIEKEKGLIKIDYKDRENFWEFSIKDNGYGIPQHQFEKIFRIFEKIDNDQQATGIGLSIVKKIIDFYEGKIWLESELDKGTTFYFTLPK